MKSENISVFGIYPTVEIAEAGVDSLRSNGFRAEDISALLPDNKGTKDFVHSRATKAPEGALTGASTGVVLGGALGWLAGIGSLAVPGVGPLIAAGPIVAMLTGVGAVGLAEMGTKDVLQEGQGCRIAPDDVAGFARTLVPLLADRAAAQALGAAGKAYAATWSEARMGEAVLALYQSLHPEAASRPRLRAA